MRSEREHRRPSAVQYIAYCYGRVLPASMRDWVRMDLTCKGAARRTMTRAIIPAFFVLAPFWLIPTTLYLHAAMTLPIFLPFILFAHALNKVWRRHRLAQHGFDPSIVDEYVRTRDAHIDRAYVERYRPRHIPSYAGRAPGESTRTVNGNSVG